MKTSCLTRNNANLIIAFLPVSLLHDSTEGQTEFNNPRTFSNTTIINTLNTGGLLNASFTSLSGATDKNPQTVTLSNVNDIRIIFPVGKTNLNHEIDSYMNKLISPFNPVFISYLSPASNNTIHVYYNNVVTAYLFDVSEFIRSDVSDRYI
jgi:hypothetical protein